MTEAVLVSREPERVLIREPGETRLVLVQEPGGGAVLARVERVGVPTEVEREAVVVREPERVLIYSGAMVPPQNLFVQPEDPGMTAPGLWVQTGLGSDGTGVTLWVEVPG